MCVAAEAKVRGACVEAEHAGWQQIKEAWVDESVLRFPDGVGTVYQRQWASLVI